MDVGHDTPDKQGDNCLQPASENYQQFLLSLKANFGGFIWKICLEILFGNFVWKICLEDRPTDRQTERLLEAPSRSLKSPRILLRTRTHINMMSVPTSISMFTFSIALPSITHCLRMPMLTMNLIVTKSH